MSKSNRHPDSAPGLAWPARLAGTIVQKLSAARVSFDHPHPYQHLPLLLASGFGRSGTTVLRKCFAAHSQIHANDHESNVIRGIMETAWANQQHPYERLNRVVSDDTFWLLFRNLVLHLHWPQATSDTGVRAISTYSHLTESAMHGLREAFPECQICYMVRNGIEVVSSFMKFPPFKEIGFQEACQRWQTQSKYIQTCESLEHVKVFRHEWFHNRERAFCELGDALSRVGLPFEDQCLDVVSSTIFHPTAYAGESPRDAGELSKRRERWRFWSDEQRKIFETECGDAMQRLGYEIPWH